MILLFINISPRNVISTGEPEGWSIDMNISSIENRSISPAIASWGNNIHVVYLEDKGGYGYNKKIYIMYVKSSDNGETWNSRIRLDNDPTNAVGPKIAVWEDTIHVIWYEYGDESLHYVKSLDNGNTWTTEEIIASECYDSNGFEIRVDNSLVHVSFPSLDFKVSYVRSEDNGITWSTPIKLIPSNSFTAGVAMAVEGSNIHIAWMDSIRAGTNPFGLRILDIFYIKSEDNGLTWASDMDISQTPSNRSKLGDICVSEGNIYIFYTQYDCIYQIYLGISRDNGDSWINNIKLTNSTASVYPPTVSTIDENIFMVWVDRRDGGSELYFKKSLDYGITWSESIRLTYRGGLNSQDIIAEHDWLHLVWDRRVKGGKNQICYNRYKIPKIPIYATIDIDPDTFNLKNKGKWITTYIELEKGYDVNDINISTILLEDTINAELHPTEIGDNDNDGILDLMVKFNRKNISELLSPSKVTVLQIIGTFTNGTFFQGKDTIRVL